MVNNCGNCRFFDQADKGSGNGVCRRFPPSMVINATLTTPAKKPIMSPGVYPPEGSTLTEVQSISGQFPPTHRDLWCGEHDERYEKRDAN